MANVYSKISRLREFLAWFVEKYPQKCFFCGELINPEAFLEGDANDGILIHHQDENRENNAIENRHFAHRGCHLRFHRFGQFAHLKAAAPKENEWSSV